MKVTERQRPAITRIIPNKELVTTDALCTAAVVLAYICIAGVRIDPLVPCRLATARWMVYVIPVTEVSASPRRTLSSPIEGFAGSTRNVAVARRPGALKQRASSIESPFACGFCACKIGTLQRPASIGPVPDKELVATDALCTATVVFAHSGVAGVRIDPLVPRRFSTIARCVPNVIPVTEGSAGPRRTLSSSVEGFAGSTRNVVIATGSSTLKYIASSVVRAGCQEARGVGKGGKTGVGTEKEKKGKKREKEKDNEKDFGQILQRPRTSSRIITALEVCER